MISGQFPSISKAMVEYNRPSWKKILMLETTRIIGDKKWPNF